MKIIHISDFHLNSSSKKSHLEEIKLILNYIVNEGFDHLIITGDLTHNADYKDFEILRSLFKKYDLLRSDKLSLMIGNHDIYGGIVTPEDIFKFPSKCEKINYHLKLNEFYLSFFETFENCVYRNDYFPYAKLFDDVLLIGMNSIMEYSRVKNPFASNGIVSLSQFIEIENILEKYSSVKRKIIFTHHHFNKIEVKNTKSLHTAWQSIERQTLKLKKKKRLYNLFKRHGIDLVLHGHFHKSEEYYRNGVRFLNAGATIKNNSERKVQINFVEVSNNKLSVKIKRIDLTNPDSVFMPANKIIENSPGLFLQ